MGKLDGKVAIVTGAASGIGKTTAETFVAEGARVLLADVDNDGIGALIGQLGHNYADGAVTDIRDEVAVQNMVAQAIRRFGRLDVAFNNAGIGGFSPIQDYPLADFERVVSICLTGTFLCIKHEAAAFISQGRGGSIINIASGASFLGLNNAMIYCGIKAGVLGLTRAAAVELGPRKIRVNAIAPGPTWTPMTAEVLSPDKLANRAERTPLRRIGQPDDVANAAFFLADAESAFISAAIISVDGGITFAYQ